MKNKITLAISVMLLATAFLACKFNMGSNTSTDSGSSNSTNRSSAKSDAPSKTASDSKPNGKTVDDEKTSDDRAESDDASDSDTSAGTDFRIRRSYYALDENRPKDLLYQDGDYMYFQKLEDGGTAGYFYSAPKKEIYVLWGGKVIAGPLTTPQQIQEVTAILSKNEQNEHEMKTNLIRKAAITPFGRIRVYDENGRLIREQ